MQREAAARNPDALGVVDLGERQDTDFFVLPPPPPPVLPLLPEVEYEELVLKEGMKISMGAPVSEQEHPTIACMTCSVQVFFNTFGYLLPFTVLYVYRDGSVLFENGTRCAACARRAGVL